MEERGGNWSSNVEDAFTPLMKYYYKVTIETENKEDVQSIGVLIEH